MISGAASVGKDNRCKASRVLLGQGGSPSGGGPARLAGTLADPPLVKRWASDSSSNPLAVVFEGLALLEILPPTLGSSPKVWPRVPSVVPIIPFSGLEKHPIASHTSIDPAGDGMEPNSAPGLY